MDTKTETAIVNFKGSLFFDGESGAGQPGHVGLVENVQVFTFSIYSEEAAVWAAQVPEYCPCFFAHDFVRHKRGSQNTGGQVAHHIMVEAISFKEVLFGVVAHSLLLCLELDGHRVVLVTISIVTSEYEYVVRFFWSAGSAEGHQTVARTARLVAVEAYRHPCAHQLEVVQPAHKCRGGILGVLIKSTKCQNISRITRY